MAEPAEKRRILLVVTRGTIGGAQRVVADLARELHGRGEDVTVAFGDGDFLKQECEQHGIPYHRLSSLKRSLNPFASLRVVYDIRRLVTREQFNVVHVHSSNALFAAVGAKLARRKPKTVFTFHGLSFLDAGARVSALKKFVVLFAYRILLPWVDERVFVSQINYETARKRGLVRSGTVIPNGIAVDSLVLLEESVARAELERIAGASFKDAFLLGSIGRLDMPKNYEFLVRVVAELQSKMPLLRIIIVGDGPERVRLESLINEQGVGDLVYLVGEVSGALRLLKAFDVFVLPSIYEGWSMSILEAMTAGLPILASDVGAAREQLGGVPEQLFPSNNLKVFSECLQKLADDQGLRNRLSSDNRKRVQSFTLQKCVDDYWSIYRKVRSMRT